MLRNISKSMGRVNTLSMAHPPNHVTKRQKSQFGTNSSSSKSAKKLTLDLIRKLPKAELHCHLDGSLPVETIIDLARRQNVQLPTFDPQKLKSMVSVTDECTSLVEYLRGFEITLSTLQSKYAISRAMYEVCEQASKDGVRYLEVRFSPILHTKEDLSLSSIMEAIVDGLHVAELNLDIVPRVIVCAMRHLNSSVTRQLAEIAWRYSNRGVVGFDLAGPESGFSSESHKEAFELIHRKLFNCTLHSGEAASWKSVHDSIRYCGAHRIGHGVRMRENPDIVQYVANDRIPIEVCITSNVQTKCVSSYEDHPIRDFFDKGLVLVPCTDNVVVSDTTLSEEYLKIQDKFDFSVAEIVRLIDFGFRSAFLELSMKKRLRAEAMYKVAKILKQEGYDISNIFGATSHLDVGLDFPNLYEDFSIQNGQKSNDSAKDFIKSEVLSRKFVGEIPKTDLNCRFGGSVSIETLWKLYNIPETKKYVDKYFESMGITSNSIQKKEDFIKLIQVDRHSGKSIIKALDVMASLLQTEEQIVAGLDDIFHNASKDNIVYLELHIRPHLHTRRGLSAAQVLQIILNNKQDMEKKYKISSSIILFVDASQDGYEQIMQSALLTVRCKDSICGFGFYGKDLKENHRYGPIFNFLKDHGITVTVSAARHDPDSVIPAIHDGGASRLSGCFKIHENPNIMNYLADHSIPIEISMTDTLRKYTEDVQSFTDSVIRFYIDRGIRVSACSFDLTLYPQTRTDILYDIAKESKMNLNELIHFVSAGYRYSFQNYWTKRKMYETFCEQANKLAKKYGFSHIYETSFIPPTSFEKTTSKQ